MTTTQVGSEEQVARLLHRAWVVAGELQQNAFALKEDETYLSVNRMAIESFNEDVNDFLSKHKQYKTADNEDCYRRVVLKVKDIRELSVCFEKEIATLSVEVEPRDAHYKTHAGIFIRVDGKCIKGGMSEDIETSDTQVISASAIL